MIFTIVLLIWIKLTGNIFIWKSFRPLNTNLDFDYEFLSVFVFIGPGAFLYWLGLWKGLYFVFVKIFHDYKSYNEIKGIIWAVLILYTYKYLPIYIKTLNSIISGVYNFLQFVWYLAPTYVITLSITLTMFYIYKYINKKLLVKVE